MSEIGWSSIFYLILREVVFFNRVTYSKVEMTEELIEEILKEAKIV